MIKLQKSTRFAIYALVELSQFPDSIISAKKIADLYNISEHHMAKVLQNLSRLGWIRSIRGINGGFQINRDPSDITLLDIVKLFEAPPEKDCPLLGSQESCQNLNICKISSVLKEIQDQAYYTLKSITLSTLISPKKIL